MKKRILAFFLAGIMTFSMAPTEAFAAADMQQSGTEVSVDLQENGTEEESPDLQQNGTEESPDLQQDGIETEAGSGSSPENEAPENSQSQNTEDVKDSADSQSQNTEDVKDSADSQSQNTENVKDSADSSQSAAENSQRARMTAEEQESLEILSQEEPVQEEQPQEQPVQDEDILKNWTPPMGGMEQPQVIGIAEETAESLDIVNPKEAADGTMEYRSSVLGSKQYDSSWDVYSTNYIYNRLTENERLFWDALDQIAREYLHGTENAARIPVQGQYYYATQSGIRYAYMGLSSQRIGELFTMFSYSNPQYYFVGNGYLTGSGAMFPIIYEGFANGTTRAAETAKVKAQIDAMEAQIAEGKTEVEKARNAHDLICRKIMYDHDYMKPVSKTPYHQSAYSVFCDNYTVCAGYTKAFTMLMNGAGVDTLSVTSNEHAWNMICLNDSWYNMDLTWDDLDGQQGLEVMYGYFNRSTAVLLGRLDQNNYHKMESCYTGMVPPATQDSGATPTSIGTIGTPTKTVAAPQIKKVQSGGKLLASISTSTSGADIYYTTDGSEPSSSATRSYYYTGESFEVAHNATVKAIAVRDTMWDSKAASAKITKSSYTVKFNTKGGNTISSQKILYGNKLKKPANPKRSNYSFQGWYTDTKYKTKWTFSSKVVTKNMTLYAKWEKVTTEKASIKKVTNVSGKKMKVTLKKITGAAGYEFRYATNSKMKSAKRVTGKSTSKTIGSLKKGKTYYVQVRAYKTDSKGKKIYGSWSVKKSVKIKK